MAALVAAIHVLAACTQQGHGWPAPAFAGAGAGAGPSSAVTNESGISRAGATVQFFLWAAKKRYHAAISRRTLMLPIGPIHCGSLAPSQIQTCKN
jgi:hypothetical protein